MKHIKAYLLILATFISIFIGYIFPNIGGAQTCEDWIAKVVSVQGNVQALREGEKEWIPVKSNDIFCQGDTIRVQEYSRAAFLLHNETILRLDQMTAITFPGIENEKISLINLLKGAAHFFSQIPRSLKVTTPFVNAAVEGTEFFVKVEHDQTFLSIFKGQVSATNEQGMLALSTGQSAIAQAEKAPVRRIELRPRDAVQWALYYPPILDYLAADFTGGTETSWQAAIRKSIEFYWKGDLSNAFSSLQDIREKIRDTRFFTYRAALLLSVGRVDEASVDIGRAFELDPLNPHALALQSIIAVVQNKKDRGLEFAKKAMQQDPESSAVRIALSYVQQAHFDLQGALGSLREAVTLDPENALAWARLAELWLSVGNLEKALEAAQEAVALNPNLARTQTVMGFAYLVQIRIQDSKNAFKKAIELDQADPLPRLGLGLAKIREGNLKAGRMEIEISASLSPNNSLIRSYLGKAYFEEKRDKLATDQFTIAKELDPLDPTPFFYDAIRKQALNRPVEALEDLEESIRLNDNRAVYRSRLLLDEDLAARSASLARIYKDLGFQQLALIEGWKSLNVDPGNYSAHRFLSDLYSSLPRHKIARVSELLKSQLLQPINITPVQPQLAESNLYIVEGAGPSDPSFNEFNQLFFRNRLALQASGVVGGDSTLGDELVHSGVRGRMSYSLGQFYYETDGFRENNDLEREIYNAFVQVSLSHKTSIQAESRYTDTEQGDLILRFDPENFLPTLKRNEKTRSIRLGLRHVFTPHSDVISSLIFRKRDKATLGMKFAPNIPITFGREIDDDGYMIEIQNLFSSELFNIISGAGYLEADRKDVKTMTSPIIPIPPEEQLQTEEKGIHYTNMYLYSKLNYPKNFTWTIGGSADFFDGWVERDQFNPKLGLTWDFLPDTTLRAAVFRVLKKMTISDQTLEPTQVSGFNQFFDDSEGTESWRYGLGIDKKFFTAVHGGAEFSKRELKVPSEIGGLNREVRRISWEEETGRAYLYWTPQQWLALSLEYWFERFERNPESVGEEDIIKSKTHRFPLGISLFHPMGFSLRLNITYTDQNGEYRNFMWEFEPGDDQFWVVDATIKYRLPRRYGFITIEGKNLFDQNFKFQDMDFAHPVIYPKRLILARFTLTY